MLFVVCMLFLSESIFSSKYCPRDTIGECNSFDRDQAGVMYISGSKLFTKVIDR